MKDYTVIYENCFKRFRKGMKRELAKSGYNKRIEFVLSKLNEEDRHILTYYNIGMNIDQIAKSMEINSKRAARKLDTAMKHLITPNNVVYITGKKLFKHEGKSLILYNMDKRYLNALDRSGITTDKDLVSWLSFHPYQIFRIPGVGVGGITQILTVVYELKKLI